VADKSTFDPALGGAQAALADPVSSAPQRPSSAPAPERSAARRGRGARLLPLGAVLLVGLAIWFAPSPAGVDPKAWHLLAIFVATVLGFIVQPMPMSAVAVLGITATVLTRTLTMGQALSGFSSTVVWLIVAAFFIATGFTKTGLGTRIAYGFMRALGRRSLGLSYSLIATDLVLAPGVPSNTARAGGVVFPILKSLGKAFGSEAELGTERRISSFLTVTTYQGTVVTSAMFVTAIAVNPLVVGFARTAGVEIGWSTWALGALVPGLLSLLAVPLVIYRLYPPEIRETPAASEIAAAELARMGPMKRDEWVMLGVFALMLVLWSFSALGVDSTAAALTGVVVLLLTGVLSWDDLLRERDAWNTMIWFATLLMMATFLGELGLMAWFNERVGGAFQGVSWVPTLIGLGLVYFYTHYFFAGNSSHAGAMYVPFLGIAVAVGAPPLATALILGWISSLMACLTHYGTAPGPIFFGSGNVPLRTWWTLGLALSVVHLVIWVVAGIPWWKAIGLL
jgi:DASS family divalent anion:Na+ symporter